MKYRLEDLGRRDRASKYLAEQLRQGQIVLLLGAGVSHGMRLPDWSDLVRRCEEVCGLPVGKKKRSTAKLMRAADDVRDAAGSGYVDKVHSALYQGFGAAEYPFDIVTEPLLIALGALVQRSTRGSVGEVITMNFDDVLEWYLHMHGVSVEVATEYPKLVNTNRDVRIYHPHGFLPLTNQFERSDFIIFSDDDFKERLAGNEGEAWSNLLVDRMSSRTLVAVGTSMSDLDTEIVIRKVKKLGGRPRPAGFVVNKRISKKNTKRLIRLGLVPVSLDEYEDIPKFLLEVCRGAALSV